MKKIEEMNIFEKLSAITSELETVGKNLTVSAGTSGSYKAVSERDILDAVKPLENKYRVYSYPFSRDVVESQIIEKTTKYGTSSQIMSRIRTIYRFVNIDNTAEYIDTTVFSEGIDSQDKGSGKAMTYADKYALMKAYKISTGDDPDKDASVEGKMTKPKSNREMLIEALIKRGIEFKTFAIEKDLTKASTEADFGKALAELELLGEDNGGVF